MARTALVDCVLGYESPCSWITIIEEALPPLVSLYADEPAARCYGVRRMDALKGSTNRGMVREMGEVVRWMV